MPFDFIQIPANGQGSAKEELNKLLRGGRIASVRKEFVVKILRRCSLNHELHEWARMDSVALFYS